MWLHVEWDLRPSSAAWLHVEWDLRPSSAAWLRVEWDLRPSSACGYMSSGTSDHPLPLWCDVRTVHGVSLLSEMASIVGSRHVDPTILARAFGTLRPGVLGHRGYIVLFRRVLYYRDSVHIYVYMYVGYKCLVMGPVVRQYASQWTCAAETPWW